MTALAQGMAGLALVMGFALLCIRQLGAASIVLAVQSAAVAVCAVVLHQPLMAIPPLLLGAGAWFAPAYLTEPPSLAPPGWSPRAGVAAGAVLAVLCQSQATLALPLTVVLLSVLLVATRRHRWPQVMALAGIQNGIVLAACLLGRNQVSLAMASGLLPLPLAAWMLVPRGLLPGPRTYGNRVARAVAWVDLGVSLTVGVATILVPLDAVGSIFAPLLALDGVLRCCQRQTRLALSPANRGLALLSSTGLVLSVCSSDLVLTWLAIVIGIFVALLPALKRRWRDAVLAFVGAGIMLFGLLVLPAAPPVLGYFSLFAGAVTIAAIVPDMAAVVAVLILRLAISEPWPPSVQILGIGIALAALVACATILLSQSPRRPISLLVQGQASLAALSACLGQADGRFAALALLVLLILSQSAARITTSPAGRLAIAGLGGVPPLGVLPGVALITLAVVRHHAWLMFPAGPALVAMLLSSLPLRPFGFSLVPSVPSVAWIPLTLTVLAGYFAPDEMVRWWHILTAGRG